MTTIVLLVVLTPPALLGLAFFTIALDVRRGLKNWE